MHGEPGSCVSACSAAGEERRPKLFAGAGSTSLDLDAHLDRVDATWHQAQSDSEECGMCCRPRHKSG
jgi:hypothetical protein